MTSEIPWIREAEELALRRGWPLYRAMSFMARRDPDAHSDAVAAMSAGSRRGKLAAPPRPPPPPAPRYVPPAARRPEVRASPPPPPVKTVWDGWCDWCFEWQGMPEPTSCSHCKQPLQRSKRSKPKAARTKQQLSLSLTRPRVERANSVGTKKRKACRGCAMCNACGKFA